MSRETDMKAGDTVVCRSPLGYSLTEGEKYILLAHEPSEREDNFTWPAYAQVRDDWGHKVWCHADRFVPAHTTKPRIRLIRGCPRCPALVGWWGVFIGGRYAWGSAGLTPAAAWVRYKHSNAGRAEPEEVQ